MDSTIIDIHLYQVLLYVALGVLLMVGFYVVTNYILPLLKQEQVKQYWQKIQIITWLTFAAMFFVTLFKANMYLTLSFALLIFGLGWNFWSNVFAGIVIKFTNQFEIGGVISTDFVKGELKAINLSQSELINEKGELIFVPNSKLRSAVLTHYHKVNDVQTHSFEVTFSKDETLKSIHQIAINCPYISANQNIEVERIKNNLYTVNASVIDKAFIESVRRYFLNISQE